MTAYQRITVSPIAGALGAEIGGIDIAAGVDDAMIAEIRRALLEHLVIFFRDQRLDPPSRSLRSAARWRRTTLCVSRIPSTALTSRFARQAFGP